MTENTVNRKEKTAATESPGQAQAPSTANPRHSISSAVERHTRFEKASFHTPGHKGRQEELFAAIDGNLDAANTTCLLSSSRDLTELPGLDDLSAPVGIIANLEERAARLWQNQGRTLVSVNGASAAITAAILACAARGEYALVPRNAHRSVVSALCLARLKPIWYAPSFEPAWGFWGASEAEPIESALTDALKQGYSVAFALVVSPTYAGAVSDISAISAITKKHGLPLIVDEAHGAHFIPGGGMPASAIACGADAVAHAWHKTLPALTQTGALHLPKGSLIDASTARSAINLVTSTSPSYLLLASMDRALSLLESEHGRQLLSQIQTLSGHLKNDLSALSALHVYDTKYGTTTSHLMVTLGAGQSHHLYEFLQDRGIFAEAILGSGLLFMLGLGSTAADSELLLATIKDFVNAYDLPAYGAKDNFAPPPFQPEMPPHQAIMLPQETVPLRQAVGRIAAQCLSPCPPGIPVLIPGQKITEEVLELISDGTVVVVAQ